MKDLLDIETAVFTFAANFSTGERAAKKKAKSVSNHQMRRFCRLRKWNERLSRAKRAFPFLVRATEKRMETFPSEIEFLSSSSAENEGLEAASGTWDSE